MKPLPNVEVVCHTPLGEELTQTSWLDEPTRIMSKEELNQILTEEAEKIREQERLKRFLHTRPTIKMAAVKP